MRWSAGRYGSTEEARRPREGHPVPGVEAAWTAGRPTDRVRAVGEGPVSLAVIGDCGADDDQIAVRLPAVRAGRWRELTRWPGAYLVIAGTARVGALTGIWRHQRGRQRSRTSNAVRREGPAEAGGLPGRRTGREPSSTRTGNLDEQQVSWT